MACNICLNSPARLFRPSTKEKTCIKCFISNFEQDIHKYIIKSKMFEKGDKVAICVSGGKDSTVLAHILNKLNKEYNYKIKLELLSIDEGIKGYRDDSLEIVKQNQLDYNLSLKILSYKTLFNTSMDEIMKNKNNIKNKSCSFCGVFRRKALEIGSKELKCNKMVLGHNADDLAETIILNFMRGDYDKLKVCTSNNTKGPFITRLKPLKYCYEKEIVLYAHYLNLKYFSTECTYAPNSTRGLVRTYIKNLEKLDPSYILNIIKYAESIQREETNKVFKRCIKCNEIGSNEICRACLFEDQLKL